jgi:hypothetical protein
MSIRTLAAATIGTLIALGLLLIRSRMKSLRCVAVSTFPTLSAPR